MLNQTNTKSAFNCMVYRTIMIKKFDHYLHLKRVSSLFCFISK